MKNPKRFKKQLGEAESFLEEIAMLSRVNRFLNSEEARMILQSQYNEAIAVMDCYIKNASEELKSHGEDYLRNITEDNFVLISEVNFKYFLAISIGSLGKVVDDCEGLANIINDIVMVKLLKRVSDRGADMLVKSFMKVFYKSQIPKGTSFETAELICYLLEDEDVALLPIDIIFS